VAEHLPVESADTLLDSLTAASDVVLFSAAIPFQLGIGHVNPQWQSWWVKRFESRGYRAVDCIRPAVWDNPDVEYWYAQNAILYLGPHATSLIAATDSQRLLDVVHPRGCAACVEEAKSYSARRVGPSTLLRELPRAIRSAMRKRLKG
jgi:hypothetical protein